MTETSKEFSLLHNFLSVTLHIRIIRPDDLYRYLSKNVNFFRRRNDEWFDLFYRYMQKLSESTALLHKASSISRGSFLGIPFIKTNTGRFEPPYVGDRGNWVPNVYLPENTQLKGVRYVDRNVYERHQLFFKTVLGLGKPDAFLYFCQQLRRNYKNRYALDDLAYINDIKECIKYLSRDEYKESMREELKEKEYIKCNDDEFCNPRIVKCSVPKTSECVFASDYYHGIGVRIVDADYYTNYGIALESLSLFGVWTHIAESRYSRNWESSYYGNAQEKDEDGFYSRLDFRELDIVISYIHEHADDENARQKSRIIMELLFLYERNLFGNIIKGKTLCAREPDIAYVIKYGFKNVPWLFTKQRLLRRPQEISKFDLDVSLYGPVKPESRIYSALGFVRNEKDKAQEAVQISLNSDHEETDAALDELLREKYNISVDTLKRLLTSHERIEGKFVAVNDNAFEFPQRPIVNFERLKKAVSETFQTAIPVMYKDVMRSVRVSEQGNINRSYLQSMYGSDSSNDSCACQMCEHETRYSMAVQLENAMKLELQIMYLSLCPNCAAVFKCIRADSSMLERFISDIFDISVSEEEPIRVKCGDRSIAFTATHLAEIQHVMWLRNRKSTEVEAIESFENITKDNEHDDKVRIQSNTKQSSEESASTFVFSKRYGNGKILEFDASGRAKIEFEDGKIREILFDYYKSKGEIDYVSPPGSRLQLGKSITKNAYLGRDYESLINAKVFNDKYGLGEIIRVSVEENKIMGLIQFPKGAIDFDLKIALQSNSIRIV